MDLLYEGATFFSFAELTLFKQYEIGLGQEEREKKNKKKEGKKGDPFFF